MTRTSSFGICELCGVRKAKAAMTAHLKKCLPLANTSRPLAPALLLRVQPGGGSMFWLHVAASRDARLGQLDDLLRNVWLECCGHLSEFYTDRRQEVSMNARIIEAFGSIGDHLNYLYDWGSSTELVVSLAALVEGASAKPMVAAQNEPPVWPCDVCGQPASSLCSDCPYDGGGFYCGRHGKQHECGENMLLPVVNSPRMGVCGYTGPSQTRKARVSAGSL